MRVEAAGDIVQFRGPMEVRQTLVSPKTARVLSGFIFVLQMKTHFEEGIDDELMSGLKEKLDVVVQKDRKVAIDLSVEEKKRLEAFEGMRAKSSLKRALSTNEYQLRLALIALDGEFFYAGGCRLVSLKAAGEDETSKGVIVDFHKR